MILYRNFIECYNVIMSECNKENLDSLRLVNLGFWYLLSIFRICYHGLPNITIRLTIYVTAILCKFSILNLYFFQCSSLHLHWNKNMVVYFPTHHHRLPSYFLHKKIAVYFFEKVLDGNSLKMMQIYTYFAENVSTNKLIMALHWKYCETPIKIW